MAHPSLFGPSAFLKKKIPSANPGVDPGLAAAAGGPGAGTGVDPRTWQRGTSTLPFNPPDDGFLEALAEAWANNDLAAGYAAADQPGAPRGGSFGSRTVRPAVPQPQSPWVKPTAHSGYGEILGHPIEGFRRRRGSIL
jgi:hypothetical protein|tara:strand:- start:774 stop:1187 length:414 start_codon:yes stop_codon:yes gene_type:complete